MPDFSQDPSNILSFILHMPTPDESQGKGARISQPFMTHLLGVRAGPALTGTKRALPTA